MEILTFATRLKMKAYRGRQAHRWVQEELLNKVQDRGYWCPVTLYGYIEDQYQRNIIFTLVQNVVVHRVQNAEGEWCSALEVATKEDAQFLYGMVGWKTS